MRWIPIAIAAVAAAGATITAAYYIYESNDDTIARAPDERFVGAFTVLPLGTVPPPADCRTPGILPTDETLIAQTVGGVSVGLPPGLALIPSSPEGGSYYGSIGDPPANRTYGVTILPSIDRYLVQPSIFREFDAINEGKPVPTPRPAGSLVDIERSLHNSFRDCVRRFSSEDLDGILVASRWEPVWDAFIQFGDDRVVILRVEDRRDELTMDQRKRDFLAVVRSVTANATPVPAR